jgi:chromate transport protein ChrA
MSDKEQSADIDEKKASNSRSFNQIIELLIRLSSYFLIGFVFVSYVVIGIRVSILGYADQNSLVADIFLGISIVAIMILLSLLISTRAKFLGAIINLVYWWFIPCNWVVDPLDPQSVSNHGKSGIIAFFPVLQGIMYTIWGILMVIAVLALVNFLINIIKTIQNKSSPNKARSETQKRNIKKPIIAGFVLLLISAPGFYMLSPYHQPLISITPANYQVKFNFWVHRPDVSNYSNTVLNELNSHSVNLDIGTHDPDMLKQWEIKCPNITYRLITSGSDTNNIIQNAKDYINTMLDYENNGTLNGWRGLCFDIEGDVFEFNSSDQTFESAAEKWELFFDWVDAKEIEKRNGTDISLECISAATQVIDQVFDSDNDLQIESMHPAYSPIDRWTTYAPMIYRCEYRQELDKPYGSVDPNDPFNSAFEFYSDLFQLSMSIKPSQRGVYMGITNCSCYGRDLDQHEYFDWGEKGGLWNLARDVLIAKSFEVPEVTFFLLKTAMENGYSMGGVFESYGEGFLTWMNKTVNSQNATETFHIQYNSGEHKGIDPSIGDWILGFNWIGGILQLVGLLFLAILMNIIKNQIEEKHASK